MNFDRGKIDIGHFRLESEDGWSVAMRGLSRGIGAHQFAARVRDAPHQDLVVIGEVFSRHRPQFDFIAIAQKTRQRRIDQERLGNLYRLAGVAAKLIRLCLTDRDDAIRREIIGRGKFKSRFAVGACFQAALPEGQGAKFFPHIFDVGRLRLFAAPRR